MIAYARLWAFAALLLPTGCWLESRTRTGEVEGFQELRVNLLPVAT